MGRLSAQSSFELNGFANPFSRNAVLINSFESNPSNYSRLNDWGLAVTYGGEFANAVNSNLYMILLSRKMLNHNITLRYTPGIKKEFIFNSNQSILLQDSSSQSLSSRFTYKEIFGAGYSYKINDNFSIGASFRLFNEDFSQENFKPVVADSIYLVRESSSESTNIWNGNIGFNYLVNDNLLISLSSINLFTTSEKSLSSSSAAFELKQNKDALLSLNYLYDKKLNLNAAFEFEGSFKTGLNYSFKLPKGEIQFGLTVFHDKYQSPYIAGAVGSVNYVNNLFGITLSGLKYFSNRNTQSSFTTFANEGIHNILNSRYSFDKATLTISFMLNTVGEKKVKLLDVDILNNIYPTLNNIYLDKPFAVGKVVNLSSKQVKLKPASKINYINTDKIFSPEISVQPNDTIEVPFYTIIPENYFQEKEELSYADFSVFTDNETPDDEIQKPVIIYGKNAWDGKVINLKYFIKRDIPFAMKYAKSILSKYKAELDTLPYSISNFYKIKLLYNNFIKNIVYASDPRATADYVQFPHETLELKGGDCDDLSSAFSSVLESIGIETALVDYRPDKGIRHVNLLINTGLSPDQSKLITNNDRKYFIRKNSNGKDEIWLVLETTSLTDFNSAWQLGAEKFNKEALDEFGLAKGKVQIINVN